MKKSFFSILFDSSFNDFITSKVISLSYILWMGMSILFAFVGVISGVLALLNGEPIGIIGFLAPVAALIFLILIRLLLEASVALIKIAENTKSE